MTKFEQFLLETLGSEESVKQLQNAAGYFLISTGIEKWARTGLACLAACRPSVGEGTR